MSATALRLVTIPFSHYCEKARWALDRTGVPYREDGYLPMLAWLPALRAGGKRTVPVLITPDRAVPDSTDILRWADGRGTCPPLWPAGDGDAAALEEQFDKSLGPAARRVAYDALLGEPRALQAMLDVAPPWQARLARPLLPVIVRMLRKGLKIEPAAVERSRRRLDEIFAEVGARLSDRRRYLTGDTFTAADLTFAALSAPLLAPPGYDKWLPPRRTWSTTMLDMVERYRATPAGQFAMRVYRDHR